MRSIWKTTTSSIGSKLVIALTGLAMIVFLIGHLAGNLLIFAGADTFNRYGHAIVSNPLLPLAELGLLAVIFTHIIFTVRMTRANRAARPVPYAAKQLAGPPSRKTTASSTMIYSGLVIAVFIIIHLKGFKYGPDYATSSTPVIRDLHRLVVESFTNPIYAGVYILAMIVLGFHLRHGVISAFQSLGADHPLFTPRWLLVGKLVAFAIAAGFALIPIIVLITGKP